MTPGSAARRQDPIQADSIAARKPRLLHLPGREHGESLHPRGLDASAGGFEVTRNEGDSDLTEAEICSLVGGHDALITGWAAPASGWRSPETPVGEQYLTGATVGIVDASHVGREVVRVLRPFAVRMLVYDPFLLRRMPMPCRSSASS